MAFEVLHVARAGPLLYGGGSVEFSQMPRTDTESPATNAGMHRHLAYVLNSVSFRGTRRGNAPSPTVTTASSLGASAAPVVHPGADRSFGFDQFAGGEEEGQLTLRGFRAIRSVNQIEAV